MKKNIVLHHVLHVIPFIIIGTSVIMFITLADEFTVDYLLSFTPENHAIAVAFFLILFAVKSLSPFLPITVLYILSGIIFSFVPALLLNLAGALIGMAIGYGIGRYTSSEYAEKMTEKYPKFKGVSEKLHNGEWFFTYILRMIPIPNEIISVYLGSMKVSFGIYFTASLVGTLPMVAVITLIGSNINNLFSPVTISAVAALAALMAISSLLHKYYPKISEILHRRHK